MKSTEKSNAKEIRTHIATLKNANWLGSARSWWPDFLFHFTDVGNAVNILQTGELLSRTEAEASGQMLTDNASPEIIEQTDERWKDYVRLYFRPRTPTQYRNEGLRPIAQRELGGSHCPTPIYFLFDSASILCHPGTVFSEGNLATGTEAYGDAEAFKKIPFEKVYHDTWFDPQDRSTIIFHRNAEVTVPNRLDLSSLKFVLCRSQAECDTLLYLLPRNTRMRWIRNISLDTRMNLFFRRWTFVEEAELSRTEITFRFNRSTLTPGPFHTLVSISETMTNATYEWENDSYQANEVLRIGLSNLSTPQDYSVHLMLDSQLAFARRYQAETSLA